MVAAVVEQRCLPYGQVGEIEKGERGREGEGGAEGGGEVVVENKTQFSKAQP